jgi:hypothetical protein
MIYATKQAANDVRGILNQQPGYPPAYVYRLARGGFTVVRTWNLKRTIRDAFDTLTLDD